jgi:hypothetical protein
MFCARQHALDEGFEPTFQAEHRLQAHGLMTVLACRPSCR